MSFKLPHFSVPNFVKIPWWAKIQTQTPACTYYFGPFETQQDAVSAQAGFVDDLCREEAEGIVVNIERSRPARLTIFDELDIRQAP